MSTLSRALVSSVSLVAFIPPAIAATAPVTTPTIVVSATRSPLPINQVASSVTVITSEEIEQKNESTVSGLLRQVPGVTVANNGGPGAPTSVFLRGANSNHVLVMVDGVRINDPSDPSDRFDFSNLTTENIERIEILRGVQSTIYGSQAIGGVINIFTKQGKGKPTSNALVEYGSYNSRRLSAGNSGEIGNTSYSFQLGNTHTDGQSSLNKRNGGFESDGNDTATFSANLASHINEYFTAKWNARYNYSYSDTDNPGNTFSLVPRPADDPLTHNYARIFNTRAAGELKMFDGVWTQEMGVSTLRVNRDAITSYYDAGVFDNLFGRQQYLGTRDQFDWVHHIKAADWQTVTLGTEAWTDRFRSNTLREVSTTSQSYFINDQLTPFTDAFLNVGARIDDYQTFGNHFTWKVAPGYHIAATGTTLKATYGTGFKAPSLAQLFAPGTGNPTLRPETSKGWDFGFEQTAWKDKLTFGSTFFRNDIDNLILFGPPPAYATTFTGKARLEGVESSVSLRPSADWKIDMGHVYTLSQDRSFSRELLRRPRHQGTLGATYQYSLNGDVGMNARYSSTRRDGDIVTFTPLYVKAFTTFDLNTNYKLNQHITFYGRLDNLLDKRYEEVSGYSQPGLSVFGGVKLGY